MTVTFAPRLMDHILPGNSTLFERTLASQVDHLLDLSVERIRNLWNPWKCHIDDLPYLAWSLSLDLWDTNWSESKKRQVVADAIELHRLKGTYAGIEKAVTIMGGALVKAVTPPGTLFLSPNYTVEEKAKFLATYPQLRVYPLRTRGRKAGFYPGDFAGFAYPVQSDAILRATPRSFIWDNGVETPLATLDRRFTQETVDIDEAIEVRQHGKGWRGKFPATTKLWPGASTAADRIYSIHTRQTFEVPGDDKLALQFARPSLDPINVKSELVAEHGVRRAFFAGQGFTSTKTWKSFPVESTARERIYHRLYLFDPNRALTRRGGSTFAGYMRLGMPAHHAELKIKIRNKRSKFAFGRFVYGFAMAEDKTGFRNVMQAVRSQKRLSDKILIDTNTIKPVTARTGLKAGSVRAGQLVETS